MIYRWMHKPVAIALGVLMIVGTLVGAVWQDSASADGTTQEPVRVVSATAKVDQALYVTYTVHFSSPVEIGIDGTIINSTAYAGRCRHLHCTYRQFILVPFNKEHTIWIDTEVIPADGDYRITSIQTSLGKLPVNVSFKIRSVS